MGRIQPEATWDTTSENGYSVFVRRGERGLIEQMNAPRGKMTQCTEQQWQKRGNIRTSGWGGGFFFAKYRSPSQAGECQS